MLVSLIAESLAQNEDLDAMQADTWEEVAALTADCIPDALIYDVGVVSDSHILPLLFKNPRLLLVGMDVETNRAVMVVGKETFSLTLDLLKEFILRN